jgi:serine/threonine protein kinase
MIANKYKLIEKISQGSFGSVYKAENNRTGEFVAMKVETKSNEGIKTLMSEAKIYQYLNNLKGFPRLKWFGTDASFNYLAIDLYLFSLNAAVKRYKILNLKTVVFFGTQMIERIQALHSKCLLHRDIKPDNLIDFGLCKRYDYDGKHISQKSITSLIGTANYASIHVHNGIEPSRRDDLESCVYILIYMLFGQLEWETCIRPDSVAQLKENILSDTKLPTFIKDMITYIRQLAFEATPNYAYLNNIYCKTT